MKRVYLALGIHNHQPVGNFDFVFEDAYRKAYQPFLEILEKHPGIRLAMHFSGILFEWIEAHHPDYVEKLRTLVEKNQVEMMTGGYYEPILTMIPEEDRLGQILKLTDTLQAKTGIRPSGMWCAERVWEPHLAKSIRKADVQYTILDDAHFKYAGLEESELRGHFITEEMGETLNLFPISETLRYAIPFKHPEATLDYLSRFANESEDNLVVFADDGEKFGIWPETFEHVYAKGWLEKFFSMLEVHSDWIRIVLFREALEKLPPVGRVYLPTASYREMMHWTLRTQAYRDYEDFENVLKQSDLFEKYKTFVRGGFWRNFLAKYHESNLMQKKMLRVSRKIHEAQNNVAESVYREALEHLWAGQCNCPYWHGVFGGLYLPHLRHANFDHLVQAQHLLDEALHRKKEWIECDVVDFDGDGVPEILVESRNMNLYFTPVGGRLFELDIRPMGMNLLNVMTRREEGYHRSLREKHLHSVDEASPSDSETDGVASIHDRVKVKESGLEKVLVNDWYPRGSLIDHFLQKETTLDKFSRCKYGEEGDFVNQQYAHAVSRKGDSMHLLLERKGNIWRQGKAVPIHLQKLVDLNSDKTKFDITITLKNESDREVEFWFGSENAFAFLSGNDPQSHYSVPGVILEQAQLSSIGEMEYVQELHLTDERLGFLVCMKVDKPAGVWRFPIETVSMSEGGFERVYQGSVVLAHWKEKLGSGESWKVKLSVEVIKL